MQHGDSCHDWHTAATLPRTCTAWWEGRCGFAQPEDAADAGVVQAVNARPLADVEALVPAQHLILLREHLPIGPACLESQQPVACAGTRVGVSQLLETSPRLAGEDGQCHERRTCENKLPQTCGDEPSQRCDLMTFPGRNT